MKIVCGYCEKETENYYSCQLPEGDEGYCCEECFEKYEKPYHEKIS